MTTPYECGTPAIEAALREAREALVKAPQCDSSDCTREGTQVWTAVLDARYALVSNTTCTFLLCEPHDAWYRELDTQHRARPMGE